jgi:hypothetical protein
MEVTLSPQFMFGGDRVKRQNGVRLFIFISAAEFVLLWFMTAQAFHRWREARHYNGELHQARVQMTSLHYQLARLKEESLPLRMSETFPASREEQACRVEVPGGVITSTQCLSNSGGGIIVMVKAEGSRSFGAEQRNETLAKVRARLLDEKRRTVGTTDVDLSGIGLEARRSGYAFVTAPPSYVRFEWREPQ